MSIRSVCLGSWVLGTLFVVLSQGSYGDDTPSYRFQRLWPPLQQPWYFFRPGGIALDADNNIYVADTSNSRIRKFTSDGQYITQFGRPGSQLGEFNFPRGLAVGPDGGGTDRLYVADTDNGRVQVFSLAGEALREIDVRVNGTGAPFPPTGVAVDAVGNLYITAGDNLRVQKITPTGAISEYVGDGTSDPTVEGCAPDLIPCGWPPGIAVDNQGHVFVADPVNFRVIRLSDDLEFQLSFGEAGQPVGGSGAAFNTPFGIAVATNGDVITTDVFNGRIHRFDNDGNFLGLFGVPGTEPGELGEVEGVAVGRHGNIYVADTSNDRIQKFTPTGRLINQIGSQGNRAGFFAFPSDVAVDGDGNVYVTDTDNFRVQKFQPGGAFERSWGEEGRGAPGLFVRPQGIAIHPDTGRVYVADTDSADSGTAPRYQIFDNDGAYFGEQEIPNVMGDAVFRDETVFPTGMVIDGDGNIFVVQSSFVNFIIPGGDNDPVRHRVQRFEPGVGVTSFGRFGAGDGEFDGPQDIAVDGNGDVYVADTFNHRIQKFDNTGNFIRAWGSFGDSEGKFNEPEGLAIAPDGNVYVADTQNNRLQVFTPDGAFLLVIGGPGDSPGQFLQPSGLAFDSDATLYVADARHNRIQCFVPTDGAAENKAIIIASGGDVAGNPLWPASQMLANMAYRTLEHQGFRKENIRYHSADTTLDLDSNGFADDILPLTTADLESTLNTWALNANNVFIYMTGLGQRDLFRLNPTEVLRKEVLDARLDTLGDAISGGMFLVYDAAQSGSFMDALSDTDHGQRIVVTSTAADEAAFFLTGGTLSFSYPLFQGIFNGASFGQVANDVRADLSFIRAYQTPQVDRNGNGIANENEDVLDIARRLFAGVDSFETLPFLEAGTPDFILAEDETTAPFFASGVADNAGDIARVWCVITPPGTVKGVENIVTSRPQFDLEESDEGRYEGVWDAFQQSGEYVIDVYAMDNNMNVALVDQVFMAKAGAVIAGTIVCGVTDTSDAPILNATLTAEPGGLTVTFNVDGIYTFAALVDGQYTITATALGFVAQSQTVTLAGGEILEVSFSLVAEGAGEGEGEGEGEKDPGTFILCHAPMGVGGGGLLNWADLVLLIVLLGCLTGSSRGRPQVRE